MTQNKRILIGLTGGIGTGKSTVSNYLKSKGYEVIDFDLLSREVYLKGYEAYNEILKVFGESVLSENGEIDRKKLGEIVFSDERLLSKLNAISHNAIYRRAEEMTESLSDDAEIVFLDVPLLFETKEYFSKYGLNLNEVWLVYADRNTQIDRIMTRDGFSREEAERRIDSQMDIEEKLSLADRVIENTGVPEEAFRTADRFLVDIGEKYHEQ